MQIIDRILAHVAADKLVHFFAGAFVGFLAAVGGAGAPTLAAVLVGGIKEASDRLANLSAYHGGTPAPHGVEWGDLAATAIGGLVADLYVYFAMPHRKNLLAVFITMV